MENLVVKEKRAEAIENYFREMRYHSDDCWVIIPHQQISGNRKQLREEIENFLREMRYHSDDCWFIIPHQQVSGNRKQLRTEAIEKYFREKRKVEGNWLGESATFQANSPRLVSEISGIPECLNSDLRDFVSQTVHHPPFQDTRPRFLEGQIRIWCTGVCTYLRVAFLYKRQKPLI
ncbi:MAG: hypothetical protein LBU62_09715 [Bacteroidales bacterium]|jgi:hypothetical protein|nr:hypothetical protein [Bacteroidales bacterium]